MKNFFLFLAAFSVLATGGVTQKVDLDTELVLLVESERDFAKASRAKGTREAFLDYLADDAILFRPHPVDGKKWMHDHPAPPGLLSWEPIFADVSRAGDLGYTTGPWQWRKGGPEDKLSAFGHYVTIWKRQPDNAWKVALDTGISHPAPINRTSDWRSHQNSRKPAGKAEQMPMVNVETERAALLLLDREFAKASTAQGTLQAYLSYLADDARFFRMNAYPVMGKKAVRAALSQTPGTLTWQPTKAEVSSAGDLAYTYGTSQFKAKAGDGKPVENGNYVRIWKKQPDGQWKVALDIVNPIPPTAAPTN